MKSRTVLLAAALAAAAMPLQAQIRPKPGTGDPRIQSIEFATDQVFQLSGAPGYSVTVELAPDEQVENVALGDSNAWQVTANHRGDHLFVKALQGGVATNMTVVTNVRLYNFELVPGSPGDIAYTVRFHYPASAEAADAAEDAPSAYGEGRYRLSGDKTLRPSAISDDGRHTYITWPRDRSIPAVYAINEAGVETLVNGMMRDDVFVVDSVAQKLVFRVDAHVARAERMKPRKADNGGQ